MTWPGQCIQDEKGLEGAAYDVFKGMHRENVVYAEIRFAPLLSENESMSCERVIEAALKGLERGKKDFGIEYGLIVCAMRHHSEEQNRRMLHTAREFFRRGCVRGRPRRCRGALPYVRLHGAFQICKAAWAAFYNPCGRVWKCTEYHRRCGGRCGQDRPWNSHERPRRT